MPTYKNEKSYPISFGRHYWVPGEEKRVPFFIPAEEIGLTVVSGDPKPRSQVLYSGEVTVPPGETVTLPVPYCRKLSLQAATEGDDVAEIHLGERSIRLDGKYGLDLDSLDWGRLGEISLSSLAGATVNLLVMEVS
jgi:hypothetical protein